MKINIINLEIHVCTTERLILIWIKNPISLYVFFFRLLKMIKNLHCKYWTNWLIDWLLTYWLDLLRLLKSSDKVQDVNQNHCQYASTLILPAVVQLSTSLFSVYHTNSLSFHTKTNNMQRFKRSCLDSKNRLTKL